MPLDSVSELPNRLETLCDPLKHFGEVLPSTLQSTKWMNLAHDPIKSTFKEKGLKTNNRSQTKPRPLGPRTPNVQDRGLVVCFGFS